MRDKAYPMSGSERQHIINFCYYLHSHDFAQKWEHHDTYNADIFAITAKIVEGRREFTHKIIEKVMDFRMGKFALRGDWQEHKNQGLIFSGHQSRYSSADDDRNVANVLLLGIDYSGSEYASSYVESLVENNIIKHSEDVIVHSLSSATKDRAEHVRFYMNGDINAISDEAKQIVIKYIIPRIVDGHGEFKEETGNKENGFKLNLLCHSHGSALAHIVENAFRDALLENPKAYGLAKKATPAQAAIFMQKVTIIAFGLPLIKAKPASRKAIPFCVALHIFSNDDILAPKTKAVIGAQIYFSGKLKEYGSALGKISPTNSLYDPNNSNRVMVLLDSGKVKTEHKDQFNVGGHGFGFYLDAVNKENNPVIHKLISKLMGNAAHPLSEYANKDLHSNPFNEAVFGEIFDNNIDRKKSALLAAKQAASEKEAWKDVASDHPFYGEIYKQ